MVFGMVVLATTVGAHARHRRAIPATGGLYDEADDTYYDCERSRRQA